MKQYIDLVNDILENGEYIENPRTNVKCLTVLNKVFYYDVQNKIFPILTTRKAYWKQAINEMICYIRGYSRLEDFHSLGVNTWDKNCEVWTSPYKSTDSDLGLIYGAASESRGIGFKDIINNIKSNPYDRGHLWNFWYPELFKCSCLRPCMYSHQFNVVGDMIHLTSVQRSVDVPLGLSFNSIQCYFLLAITAQLTGLKPGQVMHVMSNCHIYENQIDLIKEQVTREPFNHPILTGIEDLTESDIFDHGKNPVDKLKLINYNHHSPIKFPFTA